jgi:hypothetical protein
MNRAALAALLWCAVTLLAGCGKVTTSPMDGNAGDRGGIGGAGGCTAQAGCCAVDHDCSSGQECVGGTTCSAGAAASGVCASKPSQAGRCWRDDDCSGSAGRCVGAQICPCQAACLVADSPGTCAL